MLSIKCFKIRNLISKIHILRLQAVLLLLVCLILSACGVSENTSPTVLKKGDSSFTYGLTMLQTSKKYQIGDEFVLTPSIKSSWGIGNKLELSLKTFGLGLGLEAKHELYRYKRFITSWGAEADFSFPMTGYLSSRFIPMDEDFLNFVTNSFYMLGAKLYTGLMWESFVVTAFAKGGYLDKASFLPDMGSNKESSYPGFVGQAGLSFFRENSRSILALGFEAGYIFPMSLLYLSGTYRY